MFQRTSNVPYPSPADFNRWDRSIDRAAASHSGLLWGVRFGAASPPSSGPAPAAAPDGVRFQLLPQPRFVAPPMPGPESVLGRLNRGGSFLPTLASPLNPQFDLPDVSADSEPQDFSAGNADDYVSADPLDGLLSAAGTGPGAPGAWPDEAGAPTAPDEPAWPDAAFSMGPSAAGTAAGGPRRAASAPTSGAASFAAATLAEPGRGGLYAAGALPQTPKIAVSHSSSVKLKQETVWAIATEFSERNLQQFNDLKRSMTYYEASLRALFR